MSISRNDMDHLARLARLALNDDEKNLFTTQLEAMLSYVETLNELNTDGVPPTSHAVPLNNAFRPDSVTPSLGIDLALSNAPKHSDSYFLVPPVIE